MRRLSAVLTNARIINDPDTLFMELGGRIDEQKRQTARIDGLGIPGLSGQEPLETLDRRQLGPQDGLDTSHGGEPVVTVSWQQ